MGSSRGRRVSEIVLDYKIEDNDADKRAKQLLESFEAQADAIADVIRQAERFRNETLQASRVEKTLDSAVDDATRQLRDQADQLRQNARGAEEYGDAYRRASEEVEAFGDVSSNISQVAGLLRGAGAGGLADVGMLFADITDAVEGIGRLGPALGDVGNRITSVLNSLGPLGPVAVAAAGALAGVVIGMQAFSAGLREADQDIQSFVNTQQAYYDIIAEGTTEDVESAIAAQEALLANLTQQRDEIQGVLDQAYQEAGAQLGVFTGLLIELADVPGVDAARGRLDELNQELSDAEFLLGRLRGAQTDETVAANDAAVAEDRLTEARQGAVDAAIAAARAEDETAVREKYERQLALLDVERDRAKLEEDILDLEIRNNEAKAAARNQSEQRIGQLEDQFDTFLDNANKQIADAQAKAAEQREKIERDYMAKERKATEDFNRDALRAAEDYNKERVQRLRALSDDLLAAEEANDVIAFIRAQRRGSADIAQLDENASTEAKRNAEDFLAEQKERKAEAAQRLLDLRKSTAERLQEIRAGINQQRQLLQEQIASERSALQQRLDDLRQGLSIEIQTRRKGFEQSLIDQQRYNAARAALEQQLADRLLQISRQSYSGITAKLGGKTGGSAVPVPTTSYSTSGFSGVGALAGLASGLSTGNRGMLGNVSGAITNVILNGNIGSDLSRSEVTGALSRVGSAVMSAVQSGIRKAAK